MSDHGGRVDEQDTRVFAAAPPERRRHRGSEADAQDRTAELEKLISNVRHDVCGALTPALMVADSLQSNADPKVQRAGAKIAESILRATRLLKATGDRPAG